MWGERAAAHRPFLHSEGFALSFLRATSVLTLALALGAAATHTFTPAELRAFFTWVSTPGLGLSLVILVAGGLFTDFLASRRAAQGRTASPKDCCRCCVRR